MEDIKVFAMKHKKTILIVVVFGLIAIFGGMA